MMTKKEIVQWVLDAYVMIGTENNEGEDEGKSLLGGLISTLTKERVEPDSNNPAVISSKTTDKFKKHFCDFYTINAKVFEKGDEDGMVCVRLLVTNKCTFKNEINEIGESGCCDKCPSNVKKRPYINSANGILSGEFGKYYLCSDDKGDRWLVEEESFKKKYSIVR